MVELDVPVPAGAELARVEKLVERICADAGLRSTLKNTLASYPGCVHWHFTRPRERGTLEITWWRARPRLWLKVSAGRSAAWITDGLPQLQAALAAALRPAAPTTAARQER